jgi:hypothetical protein
MAKKQHYIPRLLLKKFSCDLEEKYINIHILSENKLLLKAPLYDQAQEHYLYGADQKLENAYRILEDNAGKIFSKLISGKLDLSKEDNAWIKLFILFQMNRTPSAVHTNEDILNTQIKNLASHDTFLKNHLNEFEIKLNDPYKYLFKIAVDTSQYIADLRIAILKSHTDDLIVGKAPIIILNPYLITKKWPFSIQGIGLKGAFIIMPLSPRHSILLYDNIQYALLKNNGYCILEKDDIEKLNGLQYCYTSDCVYFIGDNRKQYLIDLNNQYKYFRNENKSELEKTPLEYYKNGNIKEEIVRLGTKKPPINQEFSFVKYKEKAFLKNITNYTDGIRDRILIMESLKTKK